MKKVAIVSTVGLIYDGITSIILSYLKVMNKNNLQIFVISTGASESGIVRQFEECGCHVIELPPRREKPIEYFLKLTEFIRKNKIEIIHAHGNSATLAIEMVAGWLGGCQKRIAHSHNTKCDQVRADKILRPVFNLFYTDAIACGNEAGEWLFGSHPFMVLKNGRNVEEFLFDEEKRRKIRKEYRLDEKLVIGHVGGFVEQKNHIFLVEIFRRILAQRPDAVLFLIGDGRLKSNIENVCQDIADSVIFLGTTDHVSDYLQAMDGMLLPSLFEGLPLVAIEWQLNGLPCVFSNTITNDCKIMENAVFMPLTENADMWAKKILQLVKFNDRKKYSALAEKLIRKAGFDIKQNAEQLRSLYLCDAGGNYR